MSEIHALSGAYAVDALDDIERAQFERHLAECDACRAEVDSLQEAAALLAETTATTPSPGLRDRVLADISSVRPLPPEVGGEQADVGATVTEMTPRRRRRFVPFLAAAAAAIVIGTGGVVWQTLDDEPASRVEQIQAAADVQQYTEQLENGGTVTVYRSEDLNQAAVVTDGVPDAPAGHSYMLWLQHDEDMVPAGTMPNGSDAEVVLSGDAATADGAGITIEEAGEAPDEPEGEVVAVVGFDA